MESISRFLWIRHVKIDCSANHVLKYFAEKKYITSTEKLKKRGFYSKNVIYLTVV